MTVPSDRWRGDTDAEAAYEAECAAWEALTPEQVWGDAWPAHYPNRPAPRKDPPQ